MKIIADTHAHSLMSGHAYSTIREMARSAATKGIEILALTEHAPELEGSCKRVYFENIKVVPRELEGIQVLFGAELNILDSEGHLDLPPQLCASLDIIVASIHGLCYRSNASCEENTQAYLKIMEYPYVNVIGHPDDGHYPVDFERLVLKAKETHTLLEVNNSSLRPGGFRIHTHENMMQILKLCKKYKVPVTTASDAHVDVDAANFTYVEQLLEECEFPEELVVTTDFEKLKPYLNRYKK